MPCPHSAWPPSRKPVDESVAPPSPESTARGGEATCRASSATAPSSDLSTLSPGPVTSASGSGTTKLSTAPKSGRLASHRKSLWYAWLWVPIALIGMLALLQGFDLTTPVLPS